MDYIRHTTKATKIFSHALFIYNDHQNNK